MLVFGFAVKVFSGVLGLLAGLELDSARLVGVEIHNLNLGRAGRDGVQVGHDEVGGVAVAGLVGQGVQALAGVGGAVPASSARRVSRVAQLLGFGFEGAAAQGHGHEAAQGRHGVVAGKVSSTSPNRQQAEAGAAVELDEVVVSRLFELGQQLVYLAGFGFGRGLVVAVGAQVAQGQVGQGGGSF